MAYTPPHKRVQNMVRPTPTPSTLNPRLKGSSSLGKRPDSCGSTKIIFTRNLITKWWPVGSTEEDPIPETVRLEPISCEFIEWKSGEKPLVLVAETSGMDVMQRSMGSPPWLHIAEKMEQDLHAAFLNVKSEMGVRHSEEIRPSFVARFGKVFFHGASLENIRRAAIPERDSSISVKRSFYTNVSSEYLEAIQNSVVPKINVDFNSEREHYHVRVFDKFQDAATISCKCNLTKDGRELEIQKFELNDMRHLVVDISCLLNGTDLRLMLVTKRILTALTDEEKQSLNQLIKSAIMDPSVKGGLRWPLGKESIGERFSVVGVGHTKFKAYKSPTMRLKIRHADRFDFLTNSGEATNEINLKLKGIIGQLKDEVVEMNAIKEMLREKLKLIWDHFLSLDCLS
ncbi:hypothetical protein QJS10_CPA16g00696 [Acorus calamus]|uniref:DUF7903 domain-containing protein n=1 Tax=Acorus calamus TaxID=4465 RepID=A0AAV9D2T8_ACOCL|nr:hypothetical protein QJS10_CPA16g00696 [Acorus calamus]